MAALLSAWKVTHPRLVPSLIRNLVEAITRSLAVTALIASDELILPFVAQTLAGASPAATETMRRLMRICRQVKGAGAVQVLRRHLDHPHAELQQQVLLALPRCGCRASVEHKAQIDEA